MQLLLLIKVKNYVVEVDRIKNLKSVEKEISQISNNFIIYDQYNSVTVWLMSIRKKEKEDTFLWL